MSYNSGEDVRRVLYPKTGVHVSVDVGINRYPEKTYTSFNKT